MKALGLVVYLCQGIKGTSQGIRYTQKTSLCLCWTVLRSDQQALRTACTAILYGFLSLQFKAEF